MLLFLRKALFYLLGVFYLWVTPYTILYALGYLFNPVEKALVKTGLVSISSVPKYATVFVDGKKFSQKTPTAVRDLLPGHYHLRVFRKGFEPWEKKIRIEPEKATQLEPILLLPYRPEKEVISARSFSGMVPGILEAKIYAWESAELSSLWKIDLFFRKATSVGKEAMIPRGVEILDFLYQEKSPLVFFLILENQKRRFSVIEPGQEKKMAVRLKDWIPEDFDLLNWDPKDANQIYFLKNGDLSRIDLRRGKFYPSVATEVLGFGVKRGRLYLLKKTYALMEVNRLGENVESFLLENEALGKQIFGNVQARVYQIEVLDRDLFLFLSGPGTLISNRLPYRLIQGGVKGIRPATDSDEDRVLFWTQREIGIIDFVREKNSLFEKEPTKTILYRMGKNIRQVFWAYENSHVIFLDDDQIYLLEGKGPEPYLSKAVDSVKPGSLIYYHDGDRSIYFLDAVTHYLVKRKLVD